MRPEPISPVVGHAWAFAGYGPKLPEAVAAPEIWDHPSGLRVLSSVDPTQRGLEFHVSISMRGRWPSGADLEVARVGWPMLSTWEEDNHGGHARHFWLPLNRDMAGACDCADATQPQRVLA